MQVFEAYPVIFLERHGLTINQTALAFIGLMIGMCVGTVLTIYLQKDYPKLLKEWRGFPPVEYRLRGALVAGPTLVVGIFWLGWTGNYASVPWYVPALGGIPIGISMIMFFISFSVCQLFTLNSTLCSSSTAELSHGYVPVSLLFEISAPFVPTTPDRVYAASAFASNTMVRSIAGFVFPLFTTQVLHAVRLAH